MTPLLRSFLALLGLAWLTVALSGSAAAAPAASVARWTHDWRPGWLPGDPETPDFDLFTAPWAPTSLASPGLFVALDPITRLPVRPSADQRRALSAALLRENGLFARSDVPLPTERLPGGGELLHLPEGFQVFIMARRNAEGGYTIDCTTEPGAHDSDPGAHDSAESQPAAPPPPREER